MPNILRRIDQAVDYVVNPEHHGPGPGQPPSTGPQPAAGQPTVGQHAVVQQGAGQHAGDPAFAAAGANPAGGSGPAPNTAGPHRHDALNRLDPGVNSQAGGAYGGGYGGGQAAAATGGYGAQDDGRKYDYGPDRSRFADAADPRGNAGVDGGGAYGHGGLGGAGGGPHGQYGPGPHQQDGQYGLGHHQQAGGPHDSQFGGAPPAGPASGAVGGGAGGVPEGSYGPHGSRLGNALDPRVDSDLDSGGGPRMGAPGAGSAGQGDTTGPHRSNILNKLDPTVDSKTGETSAVGPGGNRRGL